MTFRKQFMPQEATIANIKQGLISKGKACLTRTLILLSYVQKDACQNIRLSVRVVLMGCNCLPSNNVNMMQADDAGHCMGR